MCIFVFVVPFQLVKIANWFSLLNASFSCGLKIFYGSILVFFYVRKDQVQEQSGCKLWIYCNKQKTDYLQWQLDFSNCNNVSFYDKTLYATFVQLISVFTNYTEHFQPYSISSYKRRLSNKRRAVLL